MSRLNQLMFHERKWKEALAAVQVEAQRLIAEKGEAVIGPDNEVFAKLVMQEIACEQRYNQIANI